MPCDCTIRPSHSNRILIEHGITAAACSTKMVVLTRPHRPGNAHCSASPPKHAPDSTSPPLLENSTMTPPPSLNTKPHSSRPPTPSMPPFNWPHFLPTAATPMSTTPPPQKNSPAHSANAPNSNTSSACKHWLNPAEQTINSPKPTAGTTSPEHWTANNLQHPLRNQQSAPL